MRTIFKYIPTILTLLFCLSFATPIIAQQSNGAAQVAPVLHTELSLSYQVSEPKEMRAETPMVIMLHGYRSNETNFLRLKNNFPSHFLFVSVQAPIAYSDTHFAWYGLDFSTDEKKPNLEEAAESRKKLAKFIKELQQKYAVAPDQTFLLGFSQGAIMSTSMGLLRPDLVGGVVPISGRLPKAVDFEQSSETTYPPFLIIHGESDEVISVGEAYGTLKKLNDLGAKKVDRLFHPDGHTITPDVIRTINEWFEVHAF